jgi:PKD repeat protein
VTLSPTVTSAGSVGQSLSFSAGATTSGCTSQSPSISWTFGDGGTSTQASTTHAYASAGSFPWTLTGTLDGVSATASGTVVISGPAAQYAYVVGAVTHSPGLENSLFRTDVAAINRGLAIANVTIAFAPLDGSATLQMSATVPAKGTAEWIDLIVSLFGYAADAALSGTVTVSSDQPLVVSSRTYNEGATGTFGAYLPAVTASLGIGPGQTGILPQLRKSAAFRTNVGIVNLGTTTVTAFVKLWRSTGQQAGSTTRVTVSPGRFVQATDVFTTSGAGEQSPSYASVEVETAGGKVWAYASVIDNDTNDPTIVPLVVP